MRSVLLSLSLLLGSVAVPATAAAAERCVLTVDPAVVSPDGFVELSVRGLPLAPGGGSVEVGIVVQRLGTHEGTAYFTFVWPGTTEISLRHHFDYSGENPLPPMEPGRYLVRVTTPHLHGGCSATGLFRVTGA